MRGKTPDIPARYYARMAELLLAQGVDVAALLKKADITLAELQGEALLQLEQVERLVDAALRVTGRTDLGPRLGRALKLSSHSIVGYAMLSSPTVGYALHLAARFFRLIMPTFRMRYRRAGQSLEITYAPLASMSRQCFEFHLEAIVVATHWEARDLLQQRMPGYALYLSYPEPPHAARYAELTEARCHFGWDMRPGARFVFPAAIIDQPLALADPSALQMAEARCSALVRRVVSDGHVSNWVRMMLGEASDGMPTLDELARTLNLSSRTLNRYLQKEGPGFRELAKQVRHERARAMLAEGILSVNQIAYELGYSDAANFTRAFRRLAGLSPSRYRDRHAAKSPQAQGR